MASIDDVYYIVRDIQSKLSSIDRAVSNIESRVRDIESTVDKIESATCSSYSYDTLLSKVEDIKSEIRNLR